MKKLFALAAIAVTMASCAQKEEKREEVKQDFSAEHMRNAGVDSAATSGHTTAPTASDSATVLATDSTAAK